MAASTAAATSVVALGSVERAHVERIVRAYDLTLIEVPAGELIPASYWGEPEAGLASGRLYARADTPVHSVLHETAHYACMSEARRARLQTDAGGSAHEEVAVCFLSVLLAEEIPCFGRLRMLDDMDSWGYGFRLGSAHCWFERDADDARAWLRERTLITSDLRPTWRLRA